MKRKERKVSIIMAVILSAVMGLLFAFVARKIAEPKALENMPPMPVMLITSVLESITVGVILVLILPLGRAGRGLAKKAGANPPSMKFTLLNSLPFAVISAIVVSAVCCLISVAQAHGKMPADEAPPLMAMWAKNWLRTLPLSVFVSYVLSVIISPIVVKKVGLAGPPAGMPGAGGPGAGGAGRPGNGTGRTENGAGRPGNGADDRV